jgi:hypothetical protein
LPGTLFLLAGRGFLPSAIGRRDDAGKWVLAIGFFVVGLCFLLWAYGRRRATHVQAGATSPSEQGA